MATSVAINIIDTPGHVDFTAEVERSLRVLDGAVAIFCAVGGVEPQSETVWQQADKYDVPRVAYVNKMDRIGANFANTVSEIREKLGANAVPLQIPAGEGDLFTGIIDLVAMNYRVNREDTNGTEFEDLPIPDDMLEEAKRARELMLESISSFDDQLLEKLLSDKELKAEEIRSAIRKTCLSVGVIPVLCGSSFRNMGVQKLLDAIIDFLPSPLDKPPIKGHIPGSSKIVFRKPDVEEPACALAFKIMTDPHVGKLTYFRVYSGEIKAGSYVYNVNADIKERVARILRMHANKREDLQVARAGDIVAAVGFRKTTTGHSLCDRKHPIMLELMKFPAPVISVAIEPKSLSDQEKLASSLEKLAEEDPTFIVSVNDETGQTIISGMGELHLDILTNRLLREFQVQANIGAPWVAYRETVTSQQTGEGKFIKQSGGRGQYGHVILSVEPTENGTVFAFENKLKGESIPRSYIPVIERSVKEAMNSGVIAGSPMINIKVTLLDGSQHEVDSSDLAFKVAASMAFRDAAGKANPVILEPVMKTEVVVPESYAGNVMNDFNSRRANISGIEPRKKAQVITAMVPLAEMFGYATKLRNISQGRAVFTMEFSEYRQVPESVTMRMTTGARN